MLSTILSSIINIIGETLYIHGHLRKMRIFSLLIKYIFIWTSEIMRKMAMIIMLDLLIILWKFKWREVNVPECAWRGSRSLAARWAFAWEELRVGHTCAWNSHTKSDCASLSWPEPLVSLSSVHRWTRVHFRSSLGPAAALSFSLSYKEESSLRSCTKNWRKVR